jgi:methylthioribulose-1-phosphate dehydratase
MRELAAKISIVLTEQPNAHGFLLDKHGLYSWGDNLREAKRHIEILEFLIEARGRTLELKRRGN